MGKTANFTILLYHGVHNQEPSPYPWNNFGKHIGEKEFTNQMDILRSQKTVVSMRQIDAAYRGEGDIPDGAVAVTFDDGYHNNFDVAWPILERLGIPATFYLTTGFIGSGKFTWGDTLEWAILTTDKDNFEIVIDGAVRHWPLSEPSERINCYEQIKTLCKNLMNANKDEVVRQVTKALQGTKTPDHPLSTFMDWDEARSMAQSPLIDLGAHTVDHVSLTKVPELEMKRQIDLSLLTLQQETGRDEAFFAYPEGQVHDFDDTVIAHLKNRGVTQSPSAIEGVNNFPQTSPFHLRRIAPGIGGRSFPY